jgi:hypothetical protein
MNLNDDEEAEAIQTIADYLERLGVTGLRQPFHLGRINKRAVIRYLIAEKLDEALANAPTPDGQKQRTGRITRNQKR